MNVNSNNFSGVIAFRKELLESAITGGYLKISMKKTFLYTFHYLLFLLKLFLKIVLMKF